MKTPAFLVAAALSIAAWSFPTWASPPPRPDRVDAGNRDREDRVDDRSWARTRDPEAGVDEVIVRTAPNDVDYDAYGDAPPFDGLDANGDGVIDEREARAYPPLANDFLYASGNRSTITAARYRWWAERLR